LDPFELGVAIIRRIVCGICGTIALDGGSVNGADTRAMMRAMIHRGPDAEGLLEGPGISAGIRRLAVIDVEGGGQPIASEDGAVRVVFNGEIYNYRELTEELVSRGHRFKTRSDTEVLVHLWEEYGPEMVHRLNGMFAFCLYDGRSREIFIARDRMGIKPLFYRLEGGRLIFASELAALLEHGEVPRDVEMPALAELFTLQYMAGDRTVFRNIRKLPPGHVIRVSNGSAAIRCYYDMPGGERTEVDPPDKCAEELRELLRSSVRYRLIADVPLGVFLSGGIDSSAVTLLLSEAVQRPVESFSVGFEGEAAFDEREYARLASDRLGTSHHELVVSPVDIAEQLPKLVSHLAEPVMDPAIIPTYLLSEFARRKVTVVLTGEGADELFGGYRRYLYQRRYGWLGMLPGIAAAGGLLPHRLAQALEAVRERSPHRNHLAWSAVVGRGLASELFDPAVRDGLDKRLDELFAPYFSGNSISLGRQLRADQHEWLPHNLLAKVDRASMAHSLEARVPFLDHRIVEWAAGLPDALKIRGRTTKFILRRAFEGRLPDRILGRPKRGFDLPLASWLRGPLRQLAGDLLSSGNLERWEGLNGGRVRAMLDQHMGGEQDFGLALFNILAIMIFLEEGG
jgi:asparagine synthase (glutamine-hydrolysing)